MPVIERKSSVLEDCWYAYLIDLRSMYQDDAHESFEYGMAEKSVSEGMLSVNGPGRAKRRCSTSSSSSKILLRQVLSRSRLLNIMSSLPLESGVRADLSDDKVHDDFAVRESERLSSASVGVSASVLEDIMLAGEKREFPVWR